MLSSEIVCRKFSTFLRIWLKETKVILLLTDSKPQLLHYKWLRMICTGRGHKVHYSWGMQPPQDRTQGADLPFTHPQWPTNTHVHTHTSASEQFQLAMWSLISSRHTELWCDAFILCGPFSMAPLCCPPSFLSSADSHSLPFLRFWSWNKPSAMTHVHACACVCGRSSLHTCAWQNRGVNM